MANNKIKFPLWLTPECKQIVEDNYREDQCQSRSEFIEKAIWFYAGFLHTLDAGAYLPRVLKQMLDGTLGVFAERIGRQLFKLTVEQNVNNHILASDTDIDAARYMKMPELADLNWSGFSSDERMLIDSLKKNAVTVMIRLMIANKKRNFH